MQNIIPTLMIFILLPISIYRGIRQWKIESELLKKLEKENEKR